METASTGDRVTLVGFGTFEARNRQVREGRNPQTGDMMMTTPATCVPALVLDLLKTALMQLHD